MDQTKWIKEIAEDESLWALEEMKRCAWPAPIVRDYILLKEQMEKESVYGAILTFRNLYEMTLRIPTLMALIYMDHKAEDRLTGNEKIMRILTQNPMAMGSWYELSVEITKAAKDFSIPEDLLDVIRATQEVYRLKVGDYADVVQWRNDTTAHGALKFEYHDDYRKEINELMDHYREYVFGLEKEKPAYRECYFVLNEIPLTGDVDMGALSDGDPTLTVAGETFSLGKFSSGKRFLLNSFYSGRKTVKYEDCYSGETEESSYKPFLNYFQMKFGLNEDVTKRYLSTQDDYLLKKMHEPEKYKKPVKLLERVHAFLDNPEGKGLLLLSMERGTGKTAFCYSMDGLMNHSLVKNAVVRCYSFATAQMRGMGDFISAMNEDFRRKNYPSTDMIRSVGEELPRIRPDEKEPASALAHLLNTFQKMYQETEGIGRLVLVVDGLDEITKQTERIAEFLPNGEQLNEGVFVICTSRFPDEPDVSDEVAGKITTVRRKADVCIDVRRDDPVNQAVLKTYADGWMQSNKRKRLNATQTEELLKKADHRLLRLKILLPLQDVVTDMGSTESDVFRCYLEYMQSCSDEKSFQKMLHFLVASAMYGQLSLDEYCGLIGADDLSYAFIGRLNDMMPVLTARSSDYGRVYELSNWQYRLYLLEQYPEKCESVMRQFQNAFSVWVEDNCDDDYDYRNDDYDNDNYRNDDYGREVEEQLRICDFWIRSVASMRQCADNYHLESLYYQAKFVNDVFRFAIQFPGNDAERVRSMEKQIRQLSLSLVEQCFLRDTYGSKTALPLPEGCLEPWGLFDLEEEMFPELSRLIAGRIKSGHDVEHWKDWIVIPETDVIYSEADRHFIEFSFGKHISRMVSAFCEADRLEELLQWVLQAQLGEKIHHKHSEGVWTVIPATRYTLYLQEILRYPDIAPDLRKRVSSALEEQKKFDVDDAFQELDFQGYYIEGTQNEEWHCYESQNEGPRFTEMLCEKCGVPAEEHLSEWLAEIRQLRIPSEEALVVFRYLMQHVSQTSDRIRVLKEYAYGYDTENYYRILFGKPVPDSLRDHILCTDNMIDLYLLYRKYGDHEMCHQLCRDAGKGVRRQHRDDAAHQDVYRIMEFSDLCTASGEDAFADTTEEIIEEWIEGETQKALRALDEINPYTEDTAFRKEAGPFMAKLFLSKRFDVLKHQVLTPILLKMNAFIRTSENRKLLSKLEKELRGVEHLVAYERSNRKTVSKLEEELERIEHPMVYESEESFPKSYGEAAYNDLLYESFNRKDIFTLVNDFYRDFVDDVNAGFDLPYDRLASLLDDYDEEDDTYEEDDIYEENEDFDDDDFGAVGESEHDEEEISFEEMLEKSLGSDDADGKSEDDEEELSFEEMLDASFVNAVERKEKEPSLKDSYCKRVRDGRITII